MAGPSQFAAHIKDLGLYRCCSHWEILTGGVTGPRLCLKDCSSLWVEKGTGGGERECGTHQTLPSRMEIIFKDYQKDGLGT